MLVLVHEVLHKGRINLRSFLVVTTDWKAFYPTQAEIWQYMKDVCKKFDLYPQIQFNTMVKSATWNETEQKWTVITVHNVTNDEQVLEFDIM